MYKYALHCIDSHLRCAGQVQTLPGEPHDVSADRSRYSSASEQEVGRLKALSDRPDEPSGQHRGRYTVRSDHDGSGAVRVVWTRPPGAGPRPPRAVSAENSDPGGGSNVRHRAARGSSYRHGGHPDCLQRRREDAGADDTAGGAGRRPLAPPAPGWPRAGTAGPAHG